MRMSRAECVEVLVGLQGRMSGEIGEFGRNKTLPTVSRTRKLFNLLSHFLARIKVIFHPFDFKIMRFEKLDRTFGVHKFKFVIKLSSLILVTLCIINTLALYKICLRKNFHKLKYLQFRMHYNCKII